MIEFDREGGQKPNQLLKSKWTLLNKGESEDGQLFNGNNVFFSIAVPEVGKINNFGGPNLADGIARLLVCTGKGGNIGDDTVNVNSSKGKCKDITDTWYFGVVKGWYYDATFVVRATGVFKKGWQWWDRSLSEIRGNGENGLNATLLEVLKIATRKEHGVDGVIGQVNNRTGNYGKDKYRKGWCGKEICFQWIDIASGDVKDSKHVKNCEEQDSFKGCEVGIIDVSRYTG